jgi:hypothetical protein
MAVAGCMIAHHVAAKAVRDAVFLAAWPATALPAIVIATAVLAVTAVPVYARLLSRFGPRTVVPAGFILSSAAHVVEWQLSSTNPWVAVLIYLHIAGLGALMLSGFWSLVSDLFDPRSAKANFGRITAAGTAGGVLGGTGAFSVATTLPEGSGLLLLAGLHILCGLGVAWLTRNAESALRPSTTLPPPRLFEFDALRRSPHLKTLAMLVVLSTAGAAIVDYLFKAQAEAEFASGVQLFQFFSIFYTAIQLVTFGIQTLAGRAVRQLGLGRTITSLPIGLGTTSLVALVMPAFIMFPIVRGVEAVLRGSLFRIGYELLFVPMDPSEKRRTKTFLDVTCDRTGDAFGAGVVQLLLIVSPAFLTFELLGLAIVIAGAGLWLGKRLDAMYVRVVERGLVGQVTVVPDVLGSEAAWTVLDLPTPLRTEAAGSAHQIRPVPLEAPPDPAEVMLADLRSGDLTRVERALEALDEPDDRQVAAVVQLLAWDDVVGSARQVLERHAATCTDQLLEALLDPDTDFAIRRRVPRVLRTLSSQQAVDGLVQGLDDVRFEVRYQCGRAIDRMLSAHDGLTVSRDRLLTVVERELSLPVQVWRGHRVIDSDDTSQGQPTPDRARRNVQHIFSLLAGCLPREPLQVAFGGINSGERGLRSLAREYLDSVLPDRIREKFWERLGADVEAGDGRRTPDQALEELRRSQQQPIIRPTELDSE